MSSLSTADRLDHAIDLLLAGVAPAAIDDEIAGLMKIAAELRRLPAAGFRRSLRADLEHKALLLGADGPTRRAAVSLQDEAPILPTLFGAAAAFPIHRSNFVTSFALHVAAIIAILTSSLWLAEQRTQLQPRVMSYVSTDITLPPLPASPKLTGGGGGGGDRDKLPAPKGTPPRFAAEQLAPPAVVIRNHTPELAAEPTVVGPPNITFPQSGATGDPLAALLTPPSNGVGSGGGIGSGSGGGVGGGSGPGVGPGFGGGYGGGAYRVGGGVTAPRVIYGPDPQYSEEARKAKYQGTVILWLIVDPFGRPHDVKVSRSLGMGLDQKALEAVRNWRFEPALLNGQPVPVQINVEVDFRLY